MKKAALLLNVLVVMTAGMASTARADSTQTTYTVSGTYDSSTVAAPLSTPGDNFTLQFTVPTKPGGLVADAFLGDDIYLSPMTVDFTMDGVDTQMTGALVAFYRSTSAWQGGGFFIDWCATDSSCATGLEYQWDFWGPQQYDGNESDPTMTPVDFTYTGQSFIVYNNTWEEHDSTISGTVTQQTTSVPEPGVLAMLLAGLAGIGLLLKIRN